MSHQLRVRLLALGEAIHYAGTSPVAGDLSIDEVAALADLVTGRVDDLEGQVAALR